MQSKNGLNVLSVFDGISCGMVALERAGIVVKNYYAAEIDKYATKISEVNYPNIIRLGDVTKWGEWDIDWSCIDLVLAGFPCQAWSMAGQQQGDKDPRGALFWTTLDIISNVLKHNPSAKFLMENVKMKKEFEDYITHHTEQSLGYVEKTLINSSLFSAQNRNRFYWTNFKVSQPDDKGILLKDVLYYQKEKYIGDCKLIKSSFDIGHIANAVDIKGMDCIKRVYSIHGKAPTLTTMQGGHREPKIYIGEGKYRKMNIVEMERLQTLPDNYTNHVSNTQRKSAIGNGWTVDVVAHIFKSMK